MEKVKNRRILPTGNKILVDKKFNIETLAKFQLESNKSEVDIHRYIRLTSINYTQWAKDLGVSVNTLKKNIQALILLGILKRFKSEDGQIYYKVCGWYKDGHVLFEERFLRKLLNIGSKNLIKIYLIYYKYSSTYGSCKIDQEEILKQIGFCISGKNKAMLRDINDTLRDIGLIKIEKTTVRKESETKTYLEIIAPEYTTTKFYLDAIRYTK